MENEVRLTTFSHGAGCACKLGPKELSEVMDRLGRPQMPPEVLVSEETADDAAVYALPGGEQALVATVDFFTPIVDDAFDWGRIAATNALSDVYAMGGRPAIALNLVSWPVDDLPLELLGTVLEGGRKATEEAGVVVVGGHSITDPEPKYGMAVIGFVDPKLMKRNSTAPAGARLFLTKPLGLGMISTAIKRQKATEEQVRLAVETMTTLNAPASEAMVDAGADAATDVTGFGLLGHLHEMLRASGLEAEVDAAAPELLPGVLDLAQRDVVAGGTKRNHAFLRAAVDWGDLTEPEQLILADAQTSGGLLIAARDGDALAAALEAKGILHREIGVTRKGTPGSISVRGRIAS
ncbi:MAG: selenide, water dikinase SelD [Actinomycetota bacterium]